MTDVVLVGEVDLGADDDGLHVGDELLVDLVHGLATGSDRCRRRLALRNGHHHGVLDRVIGRIVHEGVDFARLGDARRTGHCAHRRHRGRQSNDESRHGLLSSGRGSPRG